MLAIANYLSVEQNMDALMEFLNMRIPTRSDQLESATFRERLDIFHSTRHPKVAHTLGFSRQNNRPSRRKASVEQQTSSCQNTPKPKSKTWHSAQSRWIHIKDDEKRYIQVRIHIKIGHFVLLLLGFGLALLGLLPALVEGQQIGQLLEPLRLEVDLDR